MVELTTINNLKTKTGKKKTTYARGMKTAPYLFLLPYFLIYIMFSLFPIIFTFYISLYEWNGFDKPIFIGLQNYFTLFTDVRFYDAIKNTLTFMIMIIPPQLILGLVLAVILTNKKVIFRGGLRLLNFLPYLASPVAIGLIFAILFDWKYGSINYILQILGLTKEPINWLGKAIPAKFAVSIITVWRYYGYTAVLFMAGIMNINPELHEAAVIDGVNARQEFFKITLPLLKPVTLFVVITTMIGCFQIFEEPYLLFQRMIGGPENSVLTGVWLMYDTAFTSFMEYGYGSAIAYGLFIFIGIISICSFKIMNRGGE